MNFKKCLSALARKNLIKRTLRQRCRASFAKRRLVVESLETRELMAVVSAASFLESGSVGTGEVTIDVTFSEPVANGNDLPNYVLQRAGSDFQLSETDPFIWPTAATMHGNTVTLEFAPFEEDVYRLFVMDMVRDFSGNSLDGDGDGQPGGMWFRDFVVNQTTSSTQVISAAAQPSPYTNTTEESGYLRQISAGGTIIAFASAASNLVPGDNNNKTDIFVRDLLSRTTTLVTSSSSKIAANGNSRDFTISSNGRFVAFVSEATNLVDGTTIASGAVYVKDLLLGSLFVVSTRNESSNAVSGRHPSLSADGRYVAFQSESSDLVDNDFNGQSDIFVKDLQTGALQRVSVSGQAIEGSGPSFDAQISEDGSFIVFASRSENFVANDNNNQSDIFVKNIQTGALEIASVDTSGNASNGWSESPSISSDGRFVAFKTFANNLSPADTQNYSDIYVKDMLNETVFLVSSDSDGIVGNYVSTAPMISSNGQFVVFTSGASNLVNNDNNGSFDVYVKNILTNTVTLVPRAQSVFVGSDSFPSISNEGQYVSFGTLESLVSDDRRGQDTYRYDLQSGNYDIVTQVSPLLTSTTGNGDSYIGAINSDGTVIAFDSFANNIISDDVGTQGQVYVRLTSTGQVQLVSSNANGVASNQNSRNPSLTSDGQWVAFESNASNLVDTDLNGNYDIFVKNINTGVIERVSTTAVGAEANNSSWDASISGDGRFVAFVSQSSSFDEHDQNGTQDIYVKDRQTGHVIRASTDAMGTDANSFSQMPKISSDGRIVVYSSGASNLALNDTNQSGDIFAKNLVTGALQLVSADTSETAGNNQSLRPSVSSDGRYVVFESDATNLVPDDTNDRSDIFRKDLLTGQVQRVSTTSNGHQADGASYNATVSSDGRFVLFASQANLDGMSVTGNLALFVKDLHTGEVRRVFTRPDGTPVGSELNYLAAISSDGKQAVVSYGGSDAVSTDRNGFQDIFSIKLESVPAIPLGSQGVGVFEVDTSGFGVGSIIQGPNNAFDSYNRLAVDRVGYATNKASTLTDGGQSVLTPTVLMSGLEVSREVYVPSSGTISFVRTIDVFTNPTNAPILASISNHGNLGSDFQIGPDMRTIVFATSDGDLIVEPTDTWFATDDFDPIGRAPAVVHYIHGVFSAGPTEVKLELDNLSVSYALPVNPGQTVRAASFAIVAANRSDVLAAASQIELAGKLSSEASKYLSESEIDSIINFPSITVQVTSDKTNVREDSGSNAATITVTRTGNLAQPVTMQLSSSDESEATVPPTVSFPSGVSSVQVPLTAVNDDLLDGTQIVAIRASIGGNLLGTVSMGVDDAESLLLALTSTSITEKNGVATATLSRSNTDLDNALDATILFGTAGSLTAPSTITIPAGQSSVTFQILSIDNYLFDGDRDISIVATAAGYLRAEKSLTIIDEETKKPGTNPVNPLNVNNDFSVDPLDVLCVINVINRNLQPTPIFGDGNFYDVDGDLTTSPLDVLILINYLNQRGRGGNGEGEANDQNLASNMATVELDPATSLKRRQNASSVDRVFQKGLWVA